MCSSSEALPISAHHPGRNERKCTIKEWDANTHEESNDDETKACAEGVYEREPVYPTLWWKNTKQKVYVYDNKTVIVLKESLMDNMKMDKLMNCDLNITDTLLNSGHLFTCIYKNVNY